MRLIAKFRDRSSRLAWKENRDEYVRIIKIGKALGLCAGGSIPSEIEAPQQRRGGRACWSQLRQSKFHPPPFYLERIATVATCKPFFAQSRYLLQILIRMRIRSSMLIEFQRDRDVVLQSDEIAYLESPIAVLCIRILPLFHRRVFTCDPFLDNGCLTFDERNLETRALRLNADRHARDLLALHSRRMNYF
jgi:hypothetical protein